MIGPAFALPGSNVGTPRVQPEIERHVRCEYSDRNPAWFLRGLDQFALRLISKPIALGLIRLRRRIPIESVRNPAYEIEGSFNPISRCALEETMVQHLIGECADCMPKSEITNNR